MTGPALAQALRGRRGSGPRSARRSGSARTRSHAVGARAFLTMYSHTASMLYLSCAEMGTTGAASAIVPCTNALIASCWFAAAASLRAPRRPVRRGCRRGRRSRIPNARCSLRASAAGAWARGAPDQVDLVLQDDDVLQLHDLHGGQVLAGLRLRARLVGRDQQQRAVHNRRAVQHGGHEDVVPCARARRVLAQGARRRVLARGARRRVLARGARRRLSMAARTAPPNTWHDLKQQTHSTKQITAAAVTAAQPRARRHVRQQSTPMGRRRRLGRAPGQSTKETWRTSSMSVSSKPG